LIPIFTKYEPPAAFVVPMLFVATKSEEAAVPALLFCTFASIKLSTEPVMYVLMMFAPPSTVSAPAHGVDEPIDTDPAGLSPLERSERSGIVLVANVDGDDVPINMFPAIERNVHGFDVALPSDSASCGAVELAMLNVYPGDVVPTPTLPFTTLSRSMPAVRIESELLVALP
jgi:hypothetical protein